MVSVPLRPLGVVELLDGAVRLVRHNAAGAFALALPFAFARVAVGALVALSTIRESDTTTLQLLTTLGATGLFGTMRTGVLTPLFTADLLGRRIGPAEALRRAAPALPALAGTAFVVMVVQGAATLALGVGGVWLWGVWAVAAPALVSERLGPLRALGRSFALVRRAFWPTWGRRALGWAVVYGLSLVITVPFSVLAYAVTGTNPFDPSGAVAHGVSQPGLFVVVTALGGLVAAAVTGPVGSAVDVLLYADLRMRHEGMDLLMTLPAPAATGATA